MNSPAPSPASGESDRKPLRVLVCDDNAGTNDMLIAVLELAGCDTEAVMDGMDAVTAARRFRPDVALLDLDLHGPLNGFDIARALRTEPGLEDTVLIAFSGHVSNAVRLEAFAAGFDRFIAKPAPPAELLAALPYVSLPPGAFARSEPGGSPQMAV